MRTDAEIVAWIAVLFDPAACEITKHERMDAIVGAMSCGLVGREALDAAMGAIKLELGESRIWRTGVQRIADYLDAGLPLVTDAGETDLPIDTLVMRGAALAAQIDRLQSQPVSVGVDMGSPEGDKSVECVDASYLGPNGELIKHFIEIERLVAPDGDTPFETGL